MARRYPSAIWLRAELCVQTKRTRIGSLLSFIRRFLSRPAALGAPGKSTHSHHAITATTPARHAQLPAPQMRRGFLPPVRFVPVHATALSVMMAGGGPPRAHEGGSILTSFLEQPSRYLFFTGKGGVGKTALACATAIRLADAGKRILLVSTDPASNLDEMLGVPLSHRPTPIPGVDRLSALNIDPEKAADDYRERVIAPYRAHLDRRPRSPSCASSSPGLAPWRSPHSTSSPSFLRATRRAVPFDHVLFDTAPTGHTLRLLSLPRAWTGFLQSTTQGASCLGPHSGLKMQETRFAAAVEALGDRERTTIVLVTRPDRAALREVDRTSGELEALGLKNQHLVINAVFEATDRTDPVARRAGASGGARRCARCPLGCKDCPPCRSRCAPSTWSACPRCARCWTIARPHHSRVPSRRSSCLPCRRWRRSSTTSRRPAVASSW